MSTDLLDLPIRYVDYNTFWVNFKHFSILETYEYVS